MIKVGKDILEAKRLLDHGQLVAIPTETVYGLAANGLNEQSVLKIFEAKKRPAFNPLILHVADLNGIKDLVQRIPTKAYTLAKAFWPGPLTLILPKKDIVPDVVTSGLDTVGIRVPSHPLTLSLLRSLDYPLAAPSANLFGYVSPTQPEHIDESMEKSVRYVLDGGNCSVGIESTIVQVNEDLIEILRLGGIEKEAIEDLVGPVSVATHNDENPAAPGMLSAHYAPEKKIVLGNINKNIAKFKDQKIGIISFNRSFNNIEERHQYVLAESGELKDAAKNIFSILRQLDKSDVDVILAELVPNVGLGMAVNDRLRRAAVKN